MMGFLWACFLSTTVVLAGSLAAANIVADGAPPTLTAAAHLHQSSSSSRHVSPRVTDMLDLTSELGPRVAEYNTRHNRNNPERRIRLLAKAEYSNEASNSHKDRIARAIIREAAGRGELSRKDGGKKTIIAASSGNTGAAMATLGTQMGFDVNIITNKKCSKEKCNNIVKAGATLWMEEELPNSKEFSGILQGVNCYMEQERVICEHFPDEYFSVNQYENLDNMMAHYETTAQEIWDQSEGKVTHFVMAASTGGTIMGVGTYLKERNDGINVVLADPHKSNLAGILEKSRGNVSKGESMLKRAKQYTKEEGGGIQVEGAGKASLTTIMKRDGEVLKPVDEAVVVHDFDAFDACRKLDREKGVRVGGSAGLNIVACRRLAERMIDEGRKEGATLVTLLCDDGNKYASKIFDDDWVEANDPRPKRFQQRRVPSGGAQTTALEDGRVGHRLDPKDWDDYRSQMHELLDSCVDRMEAYREKSWIPPPDELASKVELNADGDGHSLPDVMKSLVGDVMPYATGNTNPRFFGWVHGGGLPSSIAADLVASTMNSNCGGRNHGANDVEIACINLLAQIAGFTSDEEGGEQPFGVLTGGTSQATIYALMAARTKKFGYSIRKKGILGMGPVRVYVSNDAHSCITRALECLGHGSDSVVRIPHNEDGSINIYKLRQQLQQDGEEGIAPLAIIGTAGSVSIGAYDDCNAIADLSAEYDTWFHVDGAFGFWTRLSNDPRIKSLTDGIERADSIALDAHKWPGVNYDCGALLVKNKRHLRDTMASRPTYLKSASDGLAGGDTWFTDYSLDLSRGFRALKLWTAMRTAGCDTIGRVVTDHCELALYMARLVNESPWLEMAHVPLSNIACFSIKSRGITAAEVAIDLQLNGKGVFSTIRLGERDCLRAALVNHRTTQSDIAQVVASIEEAVARREQALRATEFDEVLEPRVTLDCEMKMNSTSEKELTS